MGAAYFIWRREQRRPADFRAIVATIERENPEVRHLLSTAAEQEPDESGRFGFLQLRVIEQVLTHPDRILWERRFKQKFSSAANLHLFALVALLLLLSIDVRPTWWHAKPGSSPTKSAEEITVTPGDTKVERGTGLVITARFGQTPPAEATLVLVSTSGKTQRIPLARHLADPVFGTSLPEISEDGLYRVEYGTKKTRDYKIGVFDFPALTRADASLNFPAYTGLSNQTIRDTRRVSAVEGTRLTYTLQLNKPVASAKFIGKDATLALATQSNSLALLNDFTLTNTARYSLELVDADGRTNKNPMEFSIVVLPNRPPEVKVDFPRGDQRVSSLEEMQLLGEAKGEFGLLNYGVGFSVAGQEPQFVGMGQAVAANEKRQFTNQISMEKLGVAADQVVSYFAWADDYGPDGQVRRTFSDMFFAEVRPFEEIFRQDQSGESENQNQQTKQKRKPGRKPKHAAGRIAETDRHRHMEIATRQTKRSNPVKTMKTLFLHFNFRGGDCRRAVDRAGSCAARRAARSRRAGGGQFQRQLLGRHRRCSDAQQQALDQAQQNVGARAGRPGRARHGHQGNAARAGRARDGEKFAGQTARRHRRRAGRVSGVAQGHAARIPHPASAEQRRVKFRPEIPASRTSSSWTSLIWRTNKTVTKPSVRRRAPQNAQQREQTQTADRLKELAQRQQDLNDRMRELQTALQAARTDKERQDIQRTTQAPGRRAAPAACERG